MDAPWSEIAGFSAAGLSAAATFGAWMTARKAHRTAKSAAETAEAVARIEKARWHAELTPEFDATIERTGGDRATLDVQLRGPVPLRHLDALSVSIRPSDDLNRVSQLAGGRSREDIERQVWARYRFTPGADGADVDGHRVAPVPMQVGRGRPFSLELTRPPSWWEGHEVDARWRDTWLNKPMRLLLHCVRGSDEPWVVPVDVDVPFPARTRSMTTRR